MLKYLIQTSIFRYSKNYGSLTHETRIKDAVNMGNLICLLATVRTLNDKKLQNEYVIWKDARRKSSDTVTILCILSGVKNWDSHLLA